MKANVDVIVPVYKPNEYLLSLLYYLDRQTVKPQKVILINTVKEYFDEFLGPFDILSKYPFIELHHITKEEFDHGKTRNLGVSYSNTDFFLLMTCDAVPKDEFLIEKLLDNFDNPQIGTAYARQIPHKRCNMIEKYARAYNYPDTKVIKGKDDIESMGIKAFYASNVCCMYRRSVFDELGGFINHTIFNEDMIYERKMIDAGYLIAYEPKAVVMHSHNYTGIQYLKRNFDLGVSQCDNPDVFGDVKSESEGIRMVKSEAKYLCKKLMPHLVIKLVYHSGCKYIGYFLGKRYKKLPLKLVRKLSMTPSYFK